MEILPTEEQRKLAAELTDAIRYSRDDIDALLDAGADPYVNPTGITTRVRFRVLVPETALEWAAIRDRPELVERFLLMPGEIDDYRIEKLFGMAALGKSLSTLALLYERYGESLDLSRAFAYCINRGYTEGAVFLFERGAFDMCTDWIASSSEFDRFLMRYSQLNGPPSFDAGDDFFAYLFPLARIDAILHSRKVELANMKTRCFTLAELVKRGMKSDEFYCQYAERAILFDRCDVLPFLDSIFGCDALEVFGQYPMSRKGLWITRGMSPDKVEFVSKIMGPDYRFTISAGFLMGISSVKALIAHSDAEHVRHPALLVRYLIHMGLADTLAEVIDWGGVTEENFDEHLQFAQELGNTKIIAILMEYRNEHLSEPDPFDALSAQDL